jgi:hypothetical protein
VDRRNLEVTVRRRNTYRLERLKTTKEGDNNLVVVRVSSAQKDTVRLITQTYDTDEMEVVNEEDNVHRKRKVM